jgi:hypothetical protein
LLPPPQTPIKNGGSKPPPYGGMGKHYLVIFPYKSKFENHYIFLFEVL